MLLMTISIILSIHLIYTTFESWHGFKHIKNLVLQPSLVTEKAPMVSIVFSALNEEEDLESSLLSMLNLDYPQLEIIAINDRSSDRTGSILENISKRFSNLHVIHVTKLPDNWLGKNHALYLGAKKARGEWLLFTDADVLMDSALLKKAMSYVSEQQIDHLTIYEKHTNQSFWLKVLLLGFYLPYSLRVKPWRIRYKWSKKYLGHGAFNLVRKTAYEAINGHQAIAMECVDDMELGNFLKKNGYKQDTVNGREYIKREWYSSLTSMINGLSKNSFAYFKYSFLIVSCNVFFGFLYYFWPLIMVVSSSGWLFWVNVFNIFLTLCFTTLVANQFELKKTYILLYPLGVFLLLYAVCRSVFLTYYHQGVYWRDTYYSLNKLRNKPKPENTF